MFNFCCFCKSVYFKLLMYEEGKAYKTLSFFTIFLKCETNSTIGITELLQYKKTTI